MQVCDHPALLSDRATRLVTSGGQKLAAKQKGKKGRSSLGGFLVDDDATESSESSWSSSDSDSQEGSHDEQVPIQLHLSKCSMTHSLLSQRSITCNSARARHMQGGAPRTGELHEPDGGSSWCDWAEGSMEQRLLEELRKRGAHETQGVHAGGGSSMRYSQCAASGDVAVYM